MGDRPKWTGRLRELPAAARSFLLHLSQTRASGGRKPQKKLIGARATRRVCGPAALCGAGRLDRPPATRFRAPGERGRDDSWPLWIKCDYVYNVRTTQTRSDHGDMTSATASAKLIDVPSVAAWTRLKNEFGTSSRRTARGARSRSQPRHDAPRPAGSYEEFEALVKGQNKPERPSAADSMRL